MDAAELELLKTFDHDAWERWDRSIRPRLRLYFLAHGVNRSHAYEDLTQETLRKVARRVRSFRDADHAHFEGWVFETARRVYVDWVRSRVRRPEAASLPDGSEPVVDPDVATVDNGFDFRDLDPDLRWALSRLSPRQRQFFVDRHIHGMEPGAIAAQAGCAPGTVYQTLTMAKKKLKELLATRTGRQSVL